jgi:hypothetical protein
LDLIIVSDEGKKFYNFDTWFVSFLRRSSMLPTKPLSRDLCFLTGDMVVFSPSLSESDGETLLPDVDTFSLLPTI